MALAGAALVIVAALVAPLAWTALRRWWREAARRRMAPPPEPGVPAVLVGTAAPGPGGPVESRLAGVECVWHGHEVRRHYRTRPAPRRRPAHAETAERPDPSQGGEAPPGELRWDSIAEFTSPDTFVLTGPFGRLLVDGREAVPDDALMCLQRVISRSAERSGKGDDLLARVAGRISGVFRGETLEFEYLEWVVRPGEQLEVTGAVEERDGVPVLTAPPDGRLRFAAAPPAPHPPFGPADAVRAVGYGVTVVLTAAAGVTLLAIG
ncbi:GIDE domain-containing protein [Allonocardiopsis opalescens]|uniref:RING-type E3 ubiquitin transferase n=1 Tax=Allonocardiopsis opalescens TaxID=1144618 RepID=A0A2T0QA55_9ACTN|nr:GIDE domain-containing protein [Allonocardiopsis opalescens]PRY00768.1 E3 ubiquitin ligase [Allonocardiopsis opalescens]